MTLHRRDDVAPGMLRLAVGRCLIATMDASTWLEIAAVTDTHNVILNHPRLLPSLNFGDRDYESCVWEVLPQLLGAPISGRATHLANTDIIETFLELPGWLAENDEKLLRYLYAIDGASDTVLGDGTLLTAVETAAARLDVEEMRRQVARLRRDYNADPEAAVGAAKELIETVCKTILGFTGTHENNDDLPRLIKATVTHLGLDPSAVEASGDDTSQAHPMRRVLGGVSSIFRGTEELRNSRGTGHGRSGAPAIDASLARLVGGHEKLPGDGHEAARWRS